MQKEKPWWYTTGSEIADGADPYRVIERIVREAERRIWAEIRNEFSVAGNKIKTLSNPMAGYQHMRKFVAAKIREFYS